MTRLWRAWLAIVLLVLATGGALARGPAPLKYIDLAALPPEAITTLARIRAGGPFPYSRDGVVFSNRERLLPIRPRGYYHEYTVPTPRSRDRGARRIVTGAPGEHYWTSDHYASFRRSRGTP